MVQDPKVIQIVIDTGLDTKIDDFLVIKNIDKVQSVNFKVPLYLKHRER